MGIWGKHTSATWSQALAPDLRRHGRALRTELAADSVAVPCVDTNQCNKLRLIGTGQPFGRHRITDEAY